MAVEFYQPHAIHTTSIKGKLVNSLQDYWSIKGKFLLNKSNPNYSLSSNGQYARDVVDYIDKHTDMPTHAFWRNLEPEKKLLASKYLIFSDQSPSTFNITCEDPIATMVIVLNGAVVVSNSFDDNKLTFGQGKSFGAPELFDQVFDDYEHLAEPATLRKKREVENELKMVVTLSVILEKGALLKLSLLDFKENVLGMVPIVKEVAVAVVVEETDEEISGIPVEQMTEADFKCVRVKRAAKRALANIMYNFLARFQMIPHNAAIMSSEYVNAGSQGRKVTIDHSVVYVVIEGALRLNVFKTGKESTLSFTHCDGQQSVQIKTRSMPLLLLEGGAVFCLKEECFAVGAQQQQQSLPAGAMKPQYRASLQASQSEGSLLKRGKGGLKSKSGAHASLYNICIVFEKPSVYLAIPVKAFRAALRDMPYEEEKSNSQKKHSSFC